MPHGTSLARKVNAYLAILAITVVGGGAALLIIRVAYADSHDTVDFQYAEYRELLKN